jgi:hypothetical protein
VSAEVPAAIAIWPAVEPLPYGFVSSLAAAAVVLCAVAFEGLTPALPFALPWTCTRTVAFAEPCAFTCP